MEKLPLFLSLRGRRCIVVGGGTIATRKVRLLLRADAAITVVAPQISAQIARWQSERGVSVLTGPFRPGHLDDAWLVIAATAKAAVNSEVAAAANERRVPCNVVDDSGLGDVFLPAIVDRAPVTVAIGTGGRAPVLARLLKEKLDRWLPQGLGRLAEFVGSRRNAVAKSYPTPKKRADLWRRVLSGPIAQHVLDGRVSDADKALSQVLDTGRANREGMAYLVGAGPGDPGLLTLRGLEALQQADVVLYDRLVAAEILAFARQDAELISVGKDPDGVATPQETINRLLVDHVVAGKRVCRLKGGDPAFFARLGEEVQALADAGLASQVIPGISAASGAAAAAHIPLTLRGVAQAAVFVTASGRSKEEQPDWPSLARLGQTLVIFMGVRRFPSIGQQLLAHGMDADTPLVVVERATTSTQRITHASLRDLSTLAQQRNIQSPAILIIGKTVQTDRDESAHEGSGVLATAGLA